MPEETPAARPRATVKAAPRDLPELVTVRRCADAPNQIRHVKIPPEAEFQMGRADAAVLVRYAPGSFEIADEDAGVCLTC